MTNTHLPQDLLEAIENLLDDVDYTTYVLDGQTSTVTGDDDDWHDALVLISDFTVAKSQLLLSPVIKFTRTPDSSIEYYYPLREDPPITLCQP